MRRLRAVAVAVVVFVCMAVSYGQLSEAEKAAVLVGNHFNVDANITYKTANNYQVKLDVYHPEKTAVPTPVVMMIHGGGWIEGTKEGSVLYILPFLQMGFSVVNVEYRMGPVSLAP